MSDKPNAALPEKTEAKRFDIVAMASSAGGLKALSVVLSNLPGDLPAGMLLVQHLDPKQKSMMADILSRRTKLSVKTAADGEKIMPATVYIAPPDHHLLANADGTISLSKSELVHFLRPSADLLFESVATSYQDRAIAVVLSGTGTDGSKGVQAIKKMGGFVIAQDEHSDFFGMPSAAIQTASVDLILPVEEIGPTIERYVKGDVNDG